MITSPVASLLPNRPWNRLHNVFAFRHARHWREDNSDALETVPEALALINCDYPFVYSHMKFFCLRLTKSALIDLLSRGEFVVLYHPCPKPYWYVILPIYCMNTGQYSHSNEWLIKRFDIISPINSDKATIYWWNYSFVQRCKDRVLLISSLTSVSA